MKQLRVTVDGKTYDVMVEVMGDSERPGSRPEAGPIASASVSAPIVTSKRPTNSIAEDGAVLSPMSGSIVKVHVKNGDKVSAGQEIVVLEAMKMETPINAPGAGTISGLMVTPGTTVDEGQPLFKLES